MVVVKLQGGLGNQMFQYATGRSLVKEEDTVYVDKVFFKKNSINDEHFTTRNFELDIFKNLKAFRLSKYHHNLFNSNSKLFKLNRRRLSSAIKYFRQENHDYRYCVFNNLHNYKYLYLDGYFQSEKYFRHLKKELLGEFIFPPLDEKNKKIKTHIESSLNAISVHIRRGDYLKPVFADLIGVLPIEYYTKALKILDKEFSNQTFFVFSDDIKWVKENFILKNADVHFIENNKVESWKDMALMSTCKHHIIANSSFSWWGAWLSDNKGKIFAPEKWFNAQKVKFNIHDLIPQEWNIVSYD